MRKAFTMLELVFVILVMGILAKFGTNILMTTYSSFAASTTNNKILADIELTLKQISSRLQYRIKSSVIATGAGGAFVGLPNATNERVIEWIGYDIDGWLGAPTLPTWSGFIDVNDPGATGALTYLETPGTNTVNVNTVIQALSPGVAGTGIANAAIFFTGENSDITTHYGWNSGVALANQGLATHRINAVAATRLGDATGATFAGTDVYENYKLSWTAYAISHEDFDGDGATYPATHPTLAGTLIRDLVLYYDYQPWEGDTYNDGNAARVLLLKNVDTFRFTSTGSTMQIQICVDEQDALGENDGGYAVCEEKAIF